MYGKKGPLNNVANALVALRSEPTLYNVIARDEMLCAGPHATRPMRGKNRLVIGWRGMPNKPPSMKNGGKPTAPSTKKSMKNGR